VKDLVREVRPKQGVSAILRYETKPGVQAQVDWGELGTIEVDGKLKKLFCFNMILGYSRMRYVEFTLSIDTSTLIQCHLNAFEHFEGFTQEILYDNMVRREVMLWIAEQPAILSIQDVPILMCISGNGSVQSSEDNEV
ncbi:resolvase, partial [Methanosarcina mazei]